MKVKIKAIRLKESLVIIPIWEVSSYEHEDFGILLYKDDKDIFTTEDSIFDAYYDVDTKEISLGEKIEFYPKSTENRVIYSKGQTVYIKPSHKRYNELQETLIQEQLWKVDHDLVNDGLSLLEYYEYALSPEIIKTIEPDKIYNLIIYEPIYKVVGSEKKYSYFDIHTMKP